MVGIVSGGRAKARDLNNNWFISRFSKMILARLLGVMAAWRKSLEFRFIKAISVADAPSAGNHHRNAIVEMRVSGNPDMRRHAQHDGVNPGLIWIAVEDRPVLSGCGRLVGHQEVSSSRPQLGLPAARELRTVR